MEIGFPTLTDSFLAGQDIFYTQFNDVNFYVEDTDQEHLYFNILKRIFDNVKFEKIFPLHGKDNLKDHAKLNFRNRNNVYIADLDFDDILGKKEQIDNVFYLTKYSIENYLLEKNGIYEIIREKNPKLKDNKINELFDFSSMLGDCKLLLTELACTFIVIQKYDLRKEYFGLNSSRDFNFLVIPPCHKNTFLRTYFGETQDLLKEKDGRYTLNSKIREYKFNFTSLENAISNIPGKYLLNLVKHILEQKKLINNFSIETFTYKLSKECSTEPFTELKKEINAFLN